MKMTSYTTIQKFPMSKFRHHPITVAYQNLYHCNPGVDSPQSMPHKEVTPITDHKPKTLPGPKAQPASLSKPYFKLSPTPKYTPDSSSDSETDSEDCVIPLNQSVDVVDHLFPENGFQLTSRSPSPVPDPVSQQLIYQNIEHQIYDDQQIVDKEFDEPETVHLEIDDQILADQNFDDQAEIDQEFDDQEFDDHRLMTINLMTKNLMSKNLKTKILMTKS